MGMNVIQPVTILDGNQYLVQGPADKTGQATSFDNVYNRSCGDETLDEIFEDVSQEYGVNVNLLKAVAQAESGFDVNATSSCGAMGIMQLMPSTAESYGVEDPYDARQSITGGAKLLSWLLDDYNGNVSLALAGYNAGCGAVQKYGGVPPYDETVNYINKINDILDGALSNDSWTTDSMQATDLSHAYVSTGNAGNTYYPGLSVNTEVHSIGSGSGSKLNSYMSSDLFSYEDYEYFQNTITELLEKINGQGNSTDSKIQSVDSSNSVSSTSVPDLKHFDKLQLNSVVMPAMSQAFQSIMKNSPQSFYEAQASAVSPLIAKLLEQ